MHIYIYMRVCVCIYPSIYLSIYLSISMRAHRDPCIGPTETDPTVISVADLYIFLYLYLYIYIYIYISIYIYIYLSIYTYIYIYIYIYISVCVYVYLSIYLSICLSTSICIREPPPAIIAMDLLRPTHCNLSCRLLGWTLSFCTRILTFCNY